MTWRVAVLALGVAIALNACERTDSIRYRMTVEVDTPIGLRTGSSVIEVSTWRGPRWGDAPGISSKRRGEAVAVVLPGGQTLFALLRGEDGGPNYYDRLLSRALENGAESTPPMPRIFKPTEWKEEEQALQALKPTVVLPRAQYPTFIWFHDVHEPRSIEEIDPDHLSDRFGSGVRLRRITLTVTDDEVTTGLARHLPWLDHPDQYPTYSIQIPAPVTNLLGWLSVGTER
jgi:hypothetical protein